MVLCARHLHFCLLRTSAVRYPLSTSEKRSLQSLCAARAADHDRGSEHCQLQAGDKTGSHGASEMVQKLRALAALPEYSDSVPSTHIWRLTTGASETSVHTYTCGIDSHKHTHAYTHITINLKKKKTHRLTLLCVEHHSLRPRPVFMSGREAQ